MVGVISMGQHSSQRSLDMLQVCFKHLPNKFLILQTPEEQIMTRVSNGLDELYGMLWNRPRFLPQTIWMRFKDFAYNSEKIGFDAESSHGSGMRLCSTLQAKSTRHNIYLRWLQL